MKALVVGAGAVGQVFGHCLARGGAEVTFLVKPKYADQRAFTMHALNGHQTEAWTGFSVITEPTGGFDQVYITVDSTALHGDWLPALVRATGDATLVFLQPNLRDVEVIDAAVPDRARVVMGTIGFISYHAPLPGETRFDEPGMAYWFPPGGKSPFSGGRADAVVAALRAGKLPSKVVRDVRRDAAFPSAVLTTFVTALEASDWSFDDLKAELGARAAREAVHVAGHELSARPPLAMRLATRPLAFRAICALGPALIPLPLETYLRVHFTKVGAQMHASLASYVEKGRAAGLPTGALEDLARLLPAATATQHDQHA